MEVIVMEEKVVEIWINKLKEALEVDHKIKRMKEEFIGEFGIEPDYVTPNEAKKEIEITNDKQIEELVNCYRACGYEFSKDEIKRFTIILKVKEDYRNLGQTEWKLIKDYGDYLEFRKTKNNLVFKVIYNYEFID